MKDRLAEIVAHQKLEVAKLKEKQPLAPSQEQNFRFSAALQQSSLGVLAEIKRRSPSKGEIAKIADPLALVHQYEQGGAAAISVLTESHFFAGSLTDLERVAAHSSLPTLRKDFLLDPCQISESVYAGASAVLLIVSVLGEQLETMLREVKRVGLEALVEVSDEDELAIALESNAKIIGVNNRNLRTFEEDLSVSERIKQNIPDEVISVAASGMRTVLDVQRMERAGYDAVLIGEALVAAKDPTLLLQEVSRCRVF